MPPSMFRRLFICPIGLCGMTTEGDDTHLWGECPLCGRRAGVVSREAIRSFVDAQAAAKEAEEKTKAKREAVINAARRR